MDFLQTIDEGQAKQGDPATGDDVKKSAVLEPTLLQGITFNDRLLAALIKPDEASDHESIKLRKWIDDWLHAKVKNEGEQVAASLNPIAGPGHASCIL